MNPDQSLPICRSTKGTDMAVTIGDTAPDFTAETTEGTIDFHDWIGDGWAVMFSHPRNFTPICTTELGYMASIKPEFDKRDTKIIGLSVDPLDNHEKWSQEIASFQGTAPNYPLIADTDFNVAKLYGMLPADTEGVSTERTPAQNQTLRNVFVVGPDKKVKLVLIYPMTTGRNFDEVLRVLDSLQLTAEGAARDSRPVAAGGQGRDHRWCLRRAGQGALPGRLGAAAALHPPGAHDGLSTRPAVPSGAAVRPAAGRRTRSPRSARRARSTTQAWKISW